VTVVHSRINANHAALTVHSTSAAKTVEVAITDGDTVVYGTAFTPNDVAALVQAAYLLGREHATRDGGTT
jgi:hypothetical protein